jgi:hypothetical protein
VQCVAMLVHVSTITRTPAAAYSSRRNETAVQRDKDTWIGVLHSH